MKITLKPFDQRLSQRLVRNRGTLAKIGSALLLARTSDLAKTQKRRSDPRPKRLYADGEGFEPP
ncbi:MAG: hypothetical protein VXZ53_22500, partial [Planctomycetota bacterium]|nr:hypothetical protein [Planctomycetota bacterium]